jgi:hypothetical protein
MRKYLAMLILSLLIFGCSKGATNKVVLAKVNNYEITQEEFNEEFRESAFGQNDTLESRKEFLNILINRALILQQAQAEDLDKEKDFLRMIERFWEQSLLKIALDKKSKETAGSAFVDDKTIGEAYNKMLKEGKADKSYEQMYRQIKWEITQQKETQMINDWMADLRKRAQIKVNYDLLKENK